MFSNKLINISSKLHSYSYISCVRLSNISNKRITRLPSDVKVSESELKTDGNEALINTKAINRNPRNLEQLLFEQKPLGFELDSPQRIYWNKVVLEKNGKHLTGKIVHYSGRVIVSASSQELPINEQLESTGGVSAAKKIGRILAERAEESGILQVFVDDQYKEDNSTKVKAFLECLESNGIALKEPPFIFPRRKRDL